MRHQRLTRKGRTSRTAEGICAAFAEFDIPAATPGEMVEAQAFAARLIGGKIASADTLAWIQARTGASVFLVRENGELTGLVAFVLLSEEGRQAVWSDRFDGFDPAPGHVASPTDEPAAVYGWGIAATNHEAAQRLLEASQLMGRTAVAHLAYFARPVTPKGLRLMVERLMFKPLPGSTTGLVWIEPYDQQSPAAA